MAAPKADDRDPDRLCQAQRSNGRGPCSRYAARGQNVCPTHGGAAPQTLRKARERLELAADRMAKELLGIAIDPDTDANTKLKAIGMALDRAGLNPRQTIAVGPDETAPWRDVLDNIMGVARTTRDGRPLPDTPALPGPRNALPPPMIEGEVVESPYTPEDYDHVPETPLAGGNAATPAVQPPAEPAPAKPPVARQGTGLGTLEDAVARQAQQRQRG